MRVEIAVSTPAILPVFFLPAQDLETDPLPVLVAGGGIAANPKGIAPPAPLFPGDEWE